MIKILCTRNIQESLVYEAAEKDIAIMIKEFITIEEDIGEKDEPLINSLLHANNALVVFTSKHAVNILADYIHHYAAAFSPKWKIYCIANVTLQSVEQRFPMAIIAGKGYYAAELVDRLLEEDATSEIFFFCGDKHLEILPAALRKAGRKVNELVIYKTKLTPQIISEKYDGVIFFSPSAVDSFFSSNEMDEATACFSIGTTTAGAIKKYTNKDVIVSPQQEAAATIETVINYYRKKKQQHE